MSDDCDLHSARITSLEDGLLELRRDVSAMAANHATLDKTLNSLIVKLDSHFDENVEFEKLTLDTNRTVNEIKVKIAGGAMERHREVQAMVDPIWNSIRKHEAQFSICATQVKEDLKKDASAHIKVLWVSLFLLSSLALYVYTEDKTGIRSIASELRADVEELHQSKEDKHIRVIP